MNELWVARDENRQLHQFDVRPIWNGDEQRFYGSARGTFAILIPGSLYMTLLPGQCRRLVLAEETT